MDKNELLSHALLLAQKAHAGQTDRYGMPYISHPIRVMNYGRTLDEKIVGILHDVIEDNPQFDEELLLEEGFPEHIVTAVAALSRTDPEESYKAFIRRIAENPLAVSVKLNDLRDNMDLRRCTQPLTEKDLKRLNKYLRAYQLLTHKF